MAELAMSVDVSKCTGCRGCQVACKQWNGLPAVKTGFSGSYENPPRIGGDTWTRVRFVEKEDSGRMRFLFRKEQCMHCTEASCQAVCAAGAIQKTDRGMVVFNDDRCVGCKNCVVACPFHAVGLSEETGSSRKCRFCYERIENGMEPACVKACPTGAISFGDRDKMLNQAKQRVSVLHGTGVNARVYGEHELGGLHVIYVLDDEPEVYGLPAHPRVATAGLFNNWLHALAGVGVVAFAPFWLIFRERGTAPDKSVGPGVDDNA